MLSSARKLGSGLTLCVMFPCPEFSAHMNTSLIGAWKTLGFSNSWHQQQLNGRTTAVRNRLTEGYAVSTEVLELNRHFLTSQPFCVLLLKHRDQILKLFNKAAQHYRSSESKWEIRWFWFSKTHFKKKKKARILKRSFKNVSLKIHECASKIEMRLFWVTSSILPI